MLVPLCAGPTFSATCAISRSHSHLLLTSHRQSSHRFSAAAVVVTAPCDSTANEHTRHVVLDLFGPHEEVFLSAREHWWLSQAFLVNEHPYRRCLYTVQHRLVCSRQFCKTLCNVLLSSHLSFEYSTLSRQRIHLLLQRSYCIFRFWDRVESHARFESSR